MESGCALPQIRGVSNTFDVISDTNRSRLRVGQLFTPRELQTLGSTSVPVPDPRRLVHLQMPADFLVVPDGIVRALKYGVYADDQWSVDEVLALAEEARAR